MKNYPDNQSCPFPRLCAHRGFNMAAPENTLPAFAMAVALGAQEIELDLWPDKDGDLVVCHDPKVDRTSNGTGLITDLTTEEIKSLDAGSWFDPKFKGTQMPLFEEVLDLLGGKTITNIHIKSPLKNRPQMSEELIRRGKDLNYYHSNHIPIMPPLPVGVENVLPEVENRPWTPYSQEDFAKILKLLDEYHCREYAYIAGEADVLTTAREMAPDLPRCCLEGLMNYSIVDHAIEYGCQKVQLTKGLTTQAMIDKARAHGITCNLFWADAPDEAQAYLDIGIDCILTNNYQPVSEIFR